MELSDINWNYWNNFMQSCIVFYTIDYNYSKKGFNLSENDI